MIWTDLPQFAEIVQFYLPTPAAEALDLNTIRDRARAAGVPNPSLEHHTGKRSHIGQTRITCRVAMAAFLVDELRAIAVAPNQEITRLVACTDGCMAILAEMEKIVARGKGNGGD